MEFQPSRRTGKTYGKSAKRVLVHDLFGDRGSREQNSSTTSLQGSSSSTLPNNATEHEIQGANAIEVRDKLPSPSLPDPVRGTSNRNRSKVTPELEEQAAKEEDLFDFKSSDESRSNGGEKEPSKKKRRVTKLVQGAGGSMAGPAVIPGSHSGNMIDTNKSAMVVSRLPAESNVKRSTNRKMAARTQHSIHSGPKAVVTSSNKGQQTKANKQATQAVKPGTRSLSRTTTGDLLLADDYISTDNSGHLSDYSSPSMASTSGTPKRKRLSAQSGDEAAASPSQLGLTALRLTPEKPHSYGRLASPESTSGDSETPRRVRPRLIDRLDAPDRENEGAQDKHVSRDSATRHQRSSSRASPARGRARINVPKYSAGSQLPSTSERSQSSQNRQTHAVKARKTYAKERSHLSEMVDTLDVQNVSSSQLSIQGFPLAMTSNITSVLDLEDGEGDDEYASGALKSIHELRQAGATNRFDREVQAILEDIEIDDSKQSVRLQALSKLIKKFGDASFLRYFITSQQTNRLVACPSPSWDLLSVTILTIALCILAKAETSIENLRQILHTADSNAPRMLQTGVLLSDIIQDHRRLLTKTAVRELYSIEEFVSQHELLTEYGRPYVIPNEIVLYCLNKALHGLHHRKATGLVISAVTYTGILQLLQSHASRLASNIALLEADSVIHNTLSLLEVCSMPLETMKSKVLKDFTGSLAEIMKYAKQDHASVMQGILRVLVSLSNNEPDACRLLGQPDILDAIFSVIDDNFLLVATRAELEHIIDEEKLNSVILALGCLLNFAECDDQTRSRVAGGRNEGGSNIERLVAIFNSQVTKAQEATTQEHGPVLVAFGFLSMLLCTMSLDHAIRIQITQLLKDKSFAELCSAAETFCSHMRTVESLSEEDVSPNAFNSRFAAILTTIRDS